MVVVMVLGWPANTMRETNQICCVIWHQLPDYASLANAML